MAGTRRKAQYHGLDVVSFVATGTDEITAEVSWDQDVHIMAVFAQKPSAGGSTLKVMIDADPPADPPNGGAYIILGNLDMGATDTSKQFVDVTPLETRGRLTIATTGGANGKKAVTIYTRAMTADGRGR